MSREEELLSALTILQDECRRHEYCGDCPLSKDSECCVANPIKYELPNKWKLNTPEKTWNAFIQ